MSRLSSRVKRLEAVASMSTGVLYRWADSVEEADAIERELADYVGDVVIYLWEPDTTGGIEGA